MILNYLKIAFRNLAKRSGFTLVNLLGLSTGVTSCLLLLLYVQDELSYDNFHEQGEQIFRIAGSYDQGGDTRNRSAITTFLLGPQLTSVRGIEQWVRIQTGSALLQRGENSYQEENVFFADSTFFEMFSFPLVQGSPSEALDRINTIVISQSMAEKYFGEEEAMGQALIMEDVTLEVTGVMADFPSNSHFMADFVISLATMVPRYPEWVLKNNSGTSHYTYIKTSNSTTAGEITGQLAQLVKRMFTYGQPPEFFLQPLPAIYLTSQLNAEIGPNGDLVYTYIFLTIALLVLAIACINYMNLVVAKSGSRSREVALRKIIGASRYQLVFQHLAESVLLSLFAMVLGGLFTELLLPYFNQLAGKTIEQQIIGDFQFVLGLAVLGVGIGIVAGSYPAFYLSGFNVLKSLYGERIKLKGGALSFRTGLIIFQFTATAILIVGTLFIYRQLAFMQNKKLGINTDQVLYLTLPTDEIRDKHELIKNELLRLPEFVSVTVTNNDPTDRVGHWRDYEIKGENTSLSTLIVGHDFFETLQAEVVDGRTFSKDFKSDENNAYILNEAAAQFLEVDEAVGTRLKGWAFTGSDWSQKDAEVIGVVKDFHFTSLHTKIQPVVFSLYSEKTTPINYMVARYHSADMHTTLEKLAAVWEKHADERPLDFTFLDQEIQQLYESEQRFLSVFLIFSIIAIIVACLGALSLISYTVSQMTRQIGIRKVLGAPVWTIIKLVNQGFFKMIAIAFIIAVPASYFVIEDWLQTFAYRITLSWIPYAQAAFLLLLIALVTTSFQSAKAALTNPVDVLKDE